MIYAGQHLIKHKADVDAIVGGVRNIMSDWSPPTGGGIVALSDHVEAAMLDAEATYEAEGLGDFFRDNKDILRMLIELFLKSKFGGLI